MSERFKTRRPSLLVRLGDRLEKRAREKTLRMLDESLRRADESCLPPNAILIEMCLPKPMRPVPPFMPKPGPGVLRS